MLKPRSNPVHVSVRKKQKRTQTYETPKTVGIFQSKAPKIPFWYLLVRLIKSMKIPFIAAKHQILETYKLYISKQPFPWFKVSLLVLVLYMVFQKDMNFQVNMKSPDSITSDDRQNQQEPTAMSMSLPNLTKKTKPATKKSAIAHLNLATEKVGLYKKRFSNTAITEMQKFNIPASIKMGQGILASHAGESILATTYNNHFGVLCSQSADCANFESSIGTVKVKKYPSAWEGWRAHSIMLSKPPYNTLVATCGRDYKKWAKGIARLGYDNNQEYSQQLIELIETYELYKLDAISEGM